MVEILNENKNDGTKSWQVIVRSNDAVNLRVDIENVARQEVAKQYNVAVNALQSEAPPNVLPNKDMCVVVVLP